MYKELTDEELKAAMLTIDPPPKGYHWVYRGLTFLKKNAKFAYCGGWNNNPTKQDWSYELDGTADAYGCNNHYVELVEGEAMDREDVNGVRVFSLPKWGIEIHSIGEGYAALVSSKLRNFLTLKEANVIESLLLAHVCAGVSIISYQYVTGLETVMDALGNH